MVTTYFYPRINSIVYHIGIQEGAFSNGTFFVVKDSSSIDFNGSQEEFYNKVKEFIDNDSVFSYIKELIGYDSFTIFGLSNTSGISGDIKKLQALKYSKSENTESLLSNLIDKIKENVKEKPKTISNSWAYEI